MMQKNITVLLQIFLFCAGNFFPVLAQWEEISPMPVALSGGAAVEFRNKLYLIGGKNLNFYFDRVDVYDPLTDTWDTTSTSRLGYARSNAACAVYDNRIFVVGGRNSKGALRSVEAYDPDANEWTLLEDIKGPRDGAIVQVLNDSLLVIGGIDNDGAYIEKIEYYDLNGNSWINSGLKLAPSRAGGLSAGRNDTIWIFGGFYFSPLISSIKFTSSDLWSPGPDLSLARGEGAAVILGDSIMLIGGESSAGAVALVELYNIRSGLVEPGPDLPEPRAGHAAVVSGGKAYIFGGHGYSPNNVFKSVLAFEFTTTAINSETSPPAYFRLDTYPNPFNGETCIRFLLPESAMINLTVYDGQGKKVRTLIDNRLAAGTYQFYWNGSSDSQNFIASGVYYVCLRSRDHLTTHKLVYLR